MLALVAVGAFVGSTSVFIPTSFNITFTFTPTGGPTMTETDTAAKAAPLRGVY